MDAPPTAPDPDAPQHTLRTARLILRPMVVDDATPLLATFADPVVMAAFDEKPFGPDAMRAWVERNLDHQARYGYGLWTVVLTETDTVIGDCGLEWQDLGQPGAPAWSAELGYDLRSDHWGRGYATEAACAVRDHAFGVLGLDHLVSVIRVGNQRSAAVARRVGMRSGDSFRRGSVTYQTYRIDRETGS